MTQEPLRRLGLYISQSQGRGYWYIVTNHDDDSTSLTWLGDPPDMTEGEVHQLSTGLTASEMCPYVDAFALPSVKWTGSSLHCRSTPSSTAAIPVMSNESPSRR